MLLTQARAIDPEGTTARMYIPAGRWPPVCSRAREQRPVHTAHLPVIRVEAEYALDRLHSRGHRLSQRSTTGIFFLSGMAYQSACSKTPCSRVGTARRAVQRSCTPYGMHHGTNDGGLVSVGRQSLTQVCRESGPAGLHLPRSDPASCPSNLRTSHPHANSAKWARHAASLRFPLRLSASQCSPGLAGRMPDVGSSLRLCWIPPCRPTDSGVSRALHTCRRAHHTLRSEPAGGPYTLLSTRCPLWLQSLAMLIVEHISVFHSRDQQEVM